SRTAEDILMTNVLRFDIKVFDDGASFGPDGQPGRAGFNDDGNAITDFAGGLPDAAEIGYPGTDDGDFRDIGHNGYMWPAGSTAAANDVSFYSKYKLNNAYYCPQNPTKPAATDRLHKFDTWHPAINIDGTAGDDSPPYRAPE